jgi:adenosylcobinamide-GDP ribazoletransferase
MRSFLVALAFLTVMPIRFRTMPDAGIIVRSRFWYPVVGLLLGAFIGGWTGLVAWLEAPLPGAFLILAVWVGSTAALHLDGVADVCDGLFGGATPEERLKIMKDPHVGAFGIIGVVLIVLGKFAGLVHLLGWLPTSAPWLVGAAVWLARCHVVSVASLGSYPRSDGTGKLLIEATRRWEGWLQLFLTATIVSLLAVALYQVQGGFFLVMWLWLPSAVLTLLLHGLLFRRLGGTTGDCLGASIELFELTFLLSCALLKIPIRLTLALET